MTQKIDSFADILAPTAPEEFFQDIRYRKPLHVQGAADKFASVMSWEALTALINQTTIWSASTLQLVQDGRKLEAPEYCVPGANRDGAPVMVPEIEKVRGWLRQGASMVCNDIDQLSPGMKAAAGALERALGCKVQANLYCSWKAHQGFGSHYDTHEVFAIHVAGEKTWKIYGKHFEDPISHPYFKTFGHEFHEKHKGPISQTVSMKPGDLLYIPRGWYHDALATSEATIHVAFGATGPIGLDLFPMLFERAVKDPLFRTNLPAGATLADHLGQLGDRLAAYVREEEMAAQTDAFMEGFRYSRGFVTLPDDALTRTFRRNEGGIKLMRHKGAWVLTDGKQGVPIPPGLDKPIAWALDRPAFEESDLAAAFPALKPPARAKLLQDLTNMGVLQAA